MIVAKVPLRIPLAGGLTDLKDYAQEFGGVTVSTTINRHVYVVLKESYYGFTDLHYFVSDLGLPGVGYGVNGQNIHGVDERIRVRDLLQTSKVFAEFMIRGIVDK